MGELIRRDRLAREDEEERLASAAARSTRSRGRARAEESDRYRTAFERDRDRIIHSKAFRRLKHKTQVFVQHEGDYYRTRLTHSLEVSQIARSVSRVLGLDEDLAEALALSHDLGHPPFGHAGEAALDRCMKQFGGFDHNAQALVLVTRLEHRYTEFDGLNLTWETLEGLVKHNGPLLAPDQDQAGLPEAIAGFAWDLDLSTHAGLEAQIASLSDDIAYVNHDIDDGLRAGLFVAEDLTPVPLAGPIFEETARGHTNLELGRLIGEAVRRLITAMVGDLIGETRRRLKERKPTSAAEIRAADEPMAAFSDSLRSDVGALKEFLGRRMYRHERVLDVMHNAQHCLSEVFDALMAAPALLPRDWTDQCGRPGDTRTARAVCDYIAGMTDRYLLQEYQRIFHREFPL